jgi:hypothetical protein
MQLDAFITVTALVQQLQARAWSLELAHHE